jgi:membrane protease YdiL (CAAX protease family)
MATGLVPSLGGDAAGVLSATVVAPILEETVFRGFALRYLKGCGLRFWRANVLCTLAFTALHLPGWIFMRGFDGAVLTDCCWVTCFGFVLGAVAWRLPSLWAPILVHAVNNAWSAGLFTWFVR